MCWGKYAGNNSFDNPLSSISSSLSFRPLVSDNAKLGGSPSYDQWFRGDASLFGGFEYRFPKLKKLKLKVEYDPFDYFDFSANNRSDASYILRKKDRDINIGFSYSLNRNITIDASYIKGNAFNLSLNFGITFNNDLSKKKDFTPVINNNNKSKKLFYEDLLENLNKNRLLLQTSTLSESGNLDISISTSNHRNAIRSSSYAAYIANKVATNSDIDLSLINVKHINAGIELMIMYIH